VPPTHEVLNQPPPLAGYDLYDADPVLAEALHREGAGWAEEQVRALGVLAGGPEAIAWGEAADANPPVLRTHDRYGRRVDEVEFHPAWHRLLGTAVGHGLHAAPGATRGRAPRWPGRPGSTSGPRSRPATAARSA
jgi:putative acyl-CoA dehydrogenase